MVLPNQLTVLRIILTPVFLFFFLSDDPTMIQISSVIFVIAAITDWYDGWLARKFNYITDWGKFLDPLADKILTLTAFYGFVLIGVIPLWMVIVIIIRDMGITLLRIFAEIKKKSFATSRLAQWKTFIQMFFLYYLLIIYTLRTIEPVYNSNPWLFDLLFNIDIIYYCMLAITAFTFYTGVQYLIKNRKMIRKLFLSEA